MSCLGPFSFSAASPLHLQTAALEAALLSMPCVTAMPAFAPGILSIQGGGENPGGGGKGDDKKVDLGTSPDAAAATKGSGVLTLQSSRQREMIVARSIYRELTDGGFKHEEILAVAAELVGLVTENISKRDDIPRLHAALSIDLYTRPLSVRLDNCLNLADIRWVGQLVLRTENDLLKAKNLGKKSINEIKKILADLSAEMGITLSLGMQPEQLHGWQPSQG